MYTIQMILDQLPSSELTNPKLRDGDTVSCVRIFTDRQLQPNVLYLSPTAHKDTTFCHTAEGSSFFYKSELHIALNRMLEIVEYFAAWEAELTKASRSGCTLTELLDIAYPVMALPVFILDNNQWLVACSSVMENRESYGNKDIEDMVRYHSAPPEKIAEFNQSFYDCYRRTDVYPIPGGLFTKTGFAMNLFHDGRFNGVMLIDSFADPIPQGKLDLFRILGTHIQDMLNDPTSGLSIHSEESALLQYINDPLPENEELIRHRLRILSWNENDEKQMIFIRPIPGRGLSPNLHHTLLMFNRLFGLEAAVYQDGILLFLNRRLLSERSGYEPVLQRITQLSYCSGFSNSFTDIKLLPLMVKRACLALQYGVQKAGSTNHFKDHILSYFFSLAQKEDREILRHPLLDQLLSYDRRYGSTLYETCFLFLKNERSLTETAKEMGIARGTLIHRVDRINEISEGLLEDPDARMHILLSYHLEKGF